MPAALRCNKCFAYTGRWGSDPVLSILRSEIGELFSRGQRRLVEIAEPRADEYVLPDLRLGSFV